jgi:hypothetical protein
MSGWFGFILSLYLVIYALSCGARWSVLDKNNVANNNNRTQDRDSQSVIQSGDILAPEKLLLGLDLPINFIMNNRVIVQIFRNFFHPSV